LFAQQEATQGRTQGQGVDGRENHRDGHGDGKLLIEPSGDATHDGHRDEDRHHHQGGGDDRRGHFLHGRLGGLLRVHSLFDFYLNRLHNDDGVIHDDTDGQHQPQQGQHVNGEADHGEGHEGGQQGDRYGDGGDQCRPPVLDKDEDDQNHQNQGDNQGLDDFIDAGGDCQGGVQRDVIAHAFRERPGQVGHGRFDLFGQGHGIGPRSLVQGDHGAGFAVHAGEGVVGLHPQFYPGDVLEFNLGTVFRGAHDDLTELLGILQAVGQAHGIGELSTRGGWLRAELAARDDHTLSTDGVHDLGHGNTQMGKAVGFDPDAHGVVAGTENVDPTDALYAG